MNLASVSPWLKAGLDADAASRAYLYANHLKIIIFRNYTDRMEFEQDLVFSHGNPTTCTAATSIDLPVGGPYGVYVEIFNTATSVDSPIAFGWAEQLTVEESATTTVNLACFPTMPVSLALNTPTDFSLEPSQELWYAFETVPGGQYTVQALPHGGWQYVFDSQGNLLADASVLTQALPLASGDEPWYVGVAAGSLGVSGAVNIQAVLPAANEGSPAAPLALELNSMHRFRIGLASQNEGTSYYAFRSAEAGSYWIGMSWSQIAAFDWSLYDTPDFSGTALASGGPASKPRMGSLAANTDYYLKLVNADPGYTKKIDALICSPSYVQANAKNDSPPSNPLGLSLGVEHSGSVGLWNFDQDSVYRFAAPGMGYYRLACADLQLAEQWYGINAQLRTQAEDVGSSPLYSSELIPGAQVVMLLDAAGDYYLGMRPTSTSSDQDALRYRLTLSAYQPSIQSIAVSSSWVDGVLSQADPEAWFSFPVTAGKDYLIEWDDYEQGSGTQSAIAHPWLLRNSIFAAGEYCSPGAYGAPFAFHADSGDTICYLRVNSVAFAPSPEHSTGSFRIRVMEQ